MGVVLAEIAFWEPIDVLNGPAQQNVVHVRRDSQSQRRLGKRKATDTTRYDVWSQQIISTCERELAGEVGGHYKSAVMFCLNGIKEWHAEQATAHPHATKVELDREVGLEKAFFWNVVSQFDYMTEA